MLEYPVAYVVGLLAADARFAAIPAWTTRGGADCLLALLVIRADIFDPPPHVKSGLMSTIMVPERAGHWLLIIVLAHANICKCQAQMILFSRMKTWAFYARLFCLDLCQNPVT